LQAGHDAERDGTVAADHERDVTRRVYAGDEVGHFANDANDRGEIATSGVGTVDGEKLCHDVTTVVHRNSG
jgi:hypothetical protein